MRSLVTRFLPALALLTALASPALAQEDRNETYPIVYAQRPITLQPNQFMVDLNFDYLQLGGDGGDNPIFADVALEYGVMKNLTVGTLPVTLGLSPKAEVNRASAFGRYRFLYGAHFPLELAAELQVTFPFGDTANFGLNPGLRARYFINNAARLDIGAFLLVEFLKSQNDPGNRGTAIGFELPVDLSISLARQIFLTIDTGFIYPDFDVSVFNVPLGIKLGYTLPRNEEMPFLDIYATFSFPGFLSSHEELDLSDGTTSTTTDVTTDIWQLGIGATFHAF